MKADVLSNGIASSNKIENKQKQKAHGPNGAHDTMSPVAKRAKFENGDIQKSSKGSESLVSDTLEKRHRMIGRATEIHYPECPLYIEYGRGAFLYDANDKPFLDLMNNVAHVGHCHPKVTQASHNQIQQLNTNSRFLHDKIIKVAEKLKSTLPSKLSVCFFVNSGSEANDLAVQLARAYTKHYDVAVIDDAYHGHTLALMEISPYKFKRAGGLGQREFIHVLARPDSYRGDHQGNNDDPKIGEAYFKDAKRVLDQAVDNNRKIALCITESMMSCGGQIIYPAGYLKSLYDYTRSLGGICIADEVQVGIGRSGSKGFWGFQHQDVIPDVVTIGKPFGNGHPVSVVVTTEEIAQAWEDRKVPYFNTFGGNPVSMAIALSVLEVVEEEKLQENAEEVGNHCLQRLNVLKDKHQIIGDVRGFGLFIGIELSEDRVTKVPATEKANTVVYSLRNRGVLISRDGPDRNVLKIKPPMVINKKDIDFFIEQLDQVLTEL